MFVLLAALAEVLAMAEPSAASQRLPPVRYVQPTLDPAKGKLARSVAAKLLPSGTTAAAMEQNMEVAGLVHDYLMVPVRSFAELHGAKLPEEGITGPPVVRIRLLEILDPGNFQRLTIAGPIIRQMAGKAAGTKEPQLREALAIAYGQKLSLSELQALDAFLDTPDGKAFARASASIDSDFGVSAARQMVEREVLAAIPAMKSRLDQATASLPKIKDWADLNEGERREVAKLLDLDPQKITR